MTKHVDLRLPEELAERIDARAGKVGLSRNAWLVKALDWAVSQPVQTQTVKQQI
jgi:predicted HicB family RNase H-like nuclease